MDFIPQEVIDKGLNPYFTGLSILIEDVQKAREDIACLNPYFTGLSILIRVYSERPSIFGRDVSILILLDYLFLC